MTSEEKGQHEYRNNILIMVVICCAIPLIYFALSYAYQLDYAVDHMDCKQLADFLNTEPFADSMRAQVHYDRMKCVEILHWLNTNVPIVINSTRNMN